MNDIQQAADEIGFLKIECIPAGVKVEMSGAVKNIILMLVMAVVQVLIKAKDTGFFGKANKKQVVKIFTQTVLDDWRANEKEAEK